MTGVSVTEGYAFATDTTGADAGVHPDFAADGTRRCTPTCKLSSTKSLSKTVQENIVQVLSGNFQYKFRPFLHLFNAGDSWLPPGSQVKRRVDLHKAISRGI